MPIKTQPMDPKKVILGVMGLAVLVSIMVFFVVIKEVTIVVGEPKVKNFIRNIGLLHVALIEHGGIVDAVSLVFSPVTSVIVQANVRVIRKIGKANYVRLVTLVVLVNVKIRGD